MTLPVLILRPMDGARQTERRAQELGLQTVVDPLFSVEPMTWSGPAVQDFDALLLTSANAVAYGGTQLESYHPLPVLAVGEATAAAAVNAGFHIAQTGASGAQTLLDVQPAGRHRSILWLAGEQHGALDAGERQLHIVPVYRSRAIALGKKALACLRAETVVLLHSARAARHLAAELDRLHIRRDRHHAVAFSAKVAEAAGQGWRSVHTACRPDDDALLSLATGLCQSE
tara:strand:+ start:3849 stop:4535 length:687 start_codon:yes stop_codon:yes gene_type:complete